MSNKTFWIIWGAVLASPSAIALIAAVTLLLTVKAAPALDCIPEPAKLTYGEKASDAWVLACEKQFRNPLPTCHRLYAKPDDRALCLRAIEKIDAYYKQKPTPKPVAPEKAPKK